MAEVNPAEISAILKKQLKDFDSTSSLNEIGSVLTIGDGIARAYGLSNAQYGELVEFSNGTEGIVLNLEEDNVGIVLLGSSTDIKEGDTVKRTSRIASVKVGEGIVGRVVDTLGNPIDGKGELNGDLYEMPLERKAPGVLFRGMTKRVEGKVAWAETTSEGANASEPAAMQVYASFTGASIGEYCRDTGRPSLIIYDDLSKQAVAYRERSLLLRRPPGREAYPGDVFYLHSRLLERAAKVINDDAIAKEMNDLPESLKKIVKGVGSLTALPIIETQAGDVSAYIPTNVISITDGQIFLESDLFNSGVRPAINVGISVSRVGGSAQIKSMKKVSGTLKLDQAQFRELEAFAKFGSDLDAATLNVIEKGKRNVEILKQAQNDPFKVEDQVAIIYAGSKNLLRDIPVDRVKEFESEYIRVLNDKHSKILSTIKQGKLTDEVTSTLEKVCADLVSKF